MAILGQRKYRGFGPTLASEYLGKHHQVTVSRETVRAWMIEAQLWQARKQREAKVHAWRQRRVRCGELVQWDTSEHAWLEERGPKLYLISMIDDATSRLHARFVLHDSTEENMRLLWSYVESYGRPLSFYTDKASLFQTAPKTPRNLKELPRDEREPLPPTQIGRALAEVGIVWIGAHSPQAKGRVERSFQTAQDRLVKGLRVAEAKTLAQANAYLEAEFASLVEPDSDGRAGHSRRCTPSARQGPLATSVVELRRNQGSGHWLHDSVRPQALPDRSNRYSCRPARSLMCGSKSGWTAPWPFASAIATLQCSECMVRPKAMAPTRKVQKHAAASRPKSQWMKNFYLTRPDKAALSAIPAATIRGAKPIR